MSNLLTRECTIHFERRNHGARKQLALGPAPVEPTPGRVPRVTKLLALAHRFEGLLQSGTVRDYAELARLGKVSRARITQIMALLQLAPDLQEQLLFLPRVERGQDPLHMAQLQPIARELTWARQRQMWLQLSEALIR